MILKKSAYKGVKWGCLKELGAEKQAHVSPGSPEPGRAWHVRASVAQPSPLPSPVGHQAARCLSTSHRAFSEFRCLGCAPSPRLLPSFSAVGPGATGWSCAGHCRHLRKERSPKTSCAARSKRQGDRWRGRCSRSGSETIAIHVSSGARRAPRAVSSHLARLPALASHVGRSALCLKPTRDGKKRS